MSAPRNRVPQTGIVHNNPLGHTATGMNMFNHTTADTQHITKHVHRVTKLPETATWQPKLIPPQKFVSVHQESYSKAKTVEPHHLTAEEQKLAQQKALEKLMKLSVLYFGGSAGMFQAFDKQSADYMNQHELSRQLRGRNLLGQFPPEDQEALFSLFDHSGERKLLVGDLWKKLDHIVHLTHEASDHSKRKLVRGFLASKFEETEKQTESNFDDKTKPIKTTRKMEKEKEYESCIYDSEDNQVFTVAAEEEISSQVKEEFGDAITDETIEQGLLIKKQIDNEFEVALHSLQYADETALQYVNNNNSYNEISNGSKEGSFVGGSGGGSGGGIAIPQQPHHPSLEEHRNHLHAINKLTNLKMMTVPFYSLRASNLKNMELRAESLDISTTMKLQERIHELESKQAKDWEEIGNHTLSCCSAEYEFEHHNNNNKYNNSSNADERKSLSASASYNRLVLPRTGGFAAPTLSLSSSSSDFVASKSMNSLPRLESVSSPVKGSKTRDLSGAADMEFLADINNGDDSQRQQQQQQQQQSSINSPSISLSPSASASANVGPLSPIALPTNKSKSSASSPSHPHTSHLSTRTADSLAHLTADMSQHYAPVSSDRDFQYALSRNQFNSKEFDPPPNRLGYGGKRLYDPKQTIISSYGIASRYPDVGVSCEERFQTMNSEYYTEFVNAPSQPVQRADLGDADRESALREDRRRRRYERTKTNLERTKVRVELEALQKEFKESRRLAKKNEDSIRYNTSVFLHDLSCFNKLPLMSTMARKPNVKQSLKMWNGQVGPLLHKDAPEFSTTYSSSFDSSVLLTEGTFVTYHGPGLNH